MAELLEAIRENDIEKVKKIFEDPDGVDEEKIDTRGGDIRNIAIETGNYELLKLIISKMGYRKKIKKEKIKKKEKGKQREKSILYNAVEKGESHMVRYILKRAKLDIDEEINGETVLDLAIRKGSQKDIESIMKHGATLEYKHICLIIKNDWEKILDMIDEDELYEILDNHLQHLKVQYRSQKHKSNKNITNNLNNPDNNVNNTDNIGNIGNVNNADNIGNINNTDNIGNNTDISENNQQLNENNNEGTDENNEDNEDNEEDNGYSDSEEEEEGKEYMYVEECIKNKAYKCIKILRRRGEIVKKSARYYIRNRNEKRILEMIEMGYIIGRMEIREIMKKGMRKMEKWLINNEKEKLIETISEMNDEKIFRRVIEGGINKYMKIGEEYLMDYMIIKGKALLVLELIKKETKIMNRELIVWKKYDGMTLLEYALCYGDLESIKSLVKIGFYLQNKNLVDVYIHNSRNKYEILKYYMGYELDVNETNLLEQALIRFDKKMIDLIIKKGGKITDRHIALLNYQDMTGRKWGNETKITLENIFLQNRIQHSNYRSLISEYYTDLPRWKIISINKCGMMELKIIAYYAGICHYQSYDNIVKELEYQYSLYLNNKLKIERLNLDQNIYQNRENLSGTPINNILPHHCYFYQEYDKHFCFDISDFSKLKPVLSNNNYIYINPYTTLPFSSSFQSSLLYQINLFSCFGFPFLSLSLDDIHSPSLSLDSLSVSSSLLPLNFSSSSEMSFFLSNLNQPYFSPSLLSNFSRSLLLLYSSSLLSSSQFSFLKSLASISSLSSPVFSSPSDPNFPLSYLLLFLNSNLSLCLDKPTLSFAIYYSLQYSSDDYSSDSDDDLTPIFPSHPPF